MTRSNCGVEVSATATVLIGGRGMDRITGVVHREERDVYELFIDGREREAAVATLSMDDHTLSINSESRVPPFLKLDLSKSAARTLRARLRDTFDVETR